MAEATLRVFRGDSNSGQTADYRVPVAPGMVVLDALHYIQGHIAPDLAVRWNCKAGKCGSCSAEVNGRPRLTCKTRMDDLPKDEPITVLPMRSFPLIKDLVTDVSWNYRVNRKIPPFEPRKGVEWKISQLDVDRVQEFRKCIECFLCQDVCHVLREHDKKEQFAGSAWPGLLQYHEVLHGSLSRGHSHYRQRYHPAQGACSGRVLRSVDNVVQEDTGQIARPSGCAS